MAPPPLFADPSPEAARAAFADKPRGLVDKVTTVADAVRRLVHDDDYLACGGFSTNRIPVASLHEIVRQRRQNLTFAGYTSTHSFQILAAGNRAGQEKLLAKVDLAYAVGLEARGLSPHSRRVFELTRLLSSAKVYQLHLGDPDVTAAYLEEMFGCEK